MAKKDKKAKDAKKARTAEKQKKNANKADLKSKKMAKKAGDDEDDDDIDAILAQFAKEQEEQLAVQIEVCSRPSKRLNPTMVASPIHGKRELIMFGGETTENGVSKFNNDLFTYAVENNTWRKVTSKNSPLPRSSHASCAHPSGIMVMFGGEFSSPKQATFYHYGDTWVLDADTKEWDKVDVKRGPPARSGHRMCVWKNYIIMHGGFKDLGDSTTYLDDMWLFDVTTHKWLQAMFPPTHPIPDARSGHSLISHPDGAVIYGGYCKTKLKKGVQKGKVLTDAWLVKMKPDAKGIRFERRRKQGFVPSARVGTQMVFHKNRGIMFGGVYDYEESEEQIDSQFFDNLYSYQVETNRWYNVALRPRKQKRQEAVKEKARDEDLEDILNMILAKANLNDDSEGDDISQIEKLKQLEEEEAIEESKTEFPVMNHLPHPRFNATTCILNDTLYIFGGVFEKGVKEYNLDSMYAIDLSKVDGVKVIWEDLSELESAAVDSDEEDDDEDDEDEDMDDEEDNVDEDEEAEEAEEAAEDEEEEEKEDDFPDLRPWLPHPKPFESLRSFYIRTGAQFLEWSISSNRDARGKYLKKAAFDLCEDRFWERREQVSVAEDELEELGGVGEVIEKDTTGQKRR